MKKHPSNQSGFTLVEGLIIVVVIAVLAGAGYYVWNKHNTKTVTVTKTTVAAASPTTSTKNGTLYISEWNASFKYDNSKATLIDKVDSTGNTAIISSKQLGAAFPDCNLVANETSSGGASSIQRGKATGTVTGTGGATAPTFQTFLDQNPTKAVKLGDYIYVNLPPAVGCYTDSAQNALYIDVEAATASIFK